MNKLDLYNRMLGALITNGKKTKVKRILDSVFTKLVHEKKIDIVKILAFIFQKLNVFLEAKIIQKKIRKRKFWINIFPVFIHLNRRKFLVTKWFLKAVFDNKKRVSLKKNFMRSFYVFWKVVLQKLLSYEIRIIQWF